MADEQSEGKASEIFALEAKLAMARGQTLTVEQKRACKEYDQALADAYITAIPRTKYASLVGKQITQLNEICQLYEIPIEPGEDVNVLDVLRWFHAWLAKWGPKINSNRLADEQLLETRRQQEALEIRRMQAQIAKLETDVDKKRAAAISLDEVRNVMSYLAGELRKLGERLGKRFGPDAQRALNETLERIERSLQEDL